METRGDSEMIRVTSVLLILTANKHLETLSYISLRILDSIMFKESSFVFKPCLIYPAPSCWPTPALSPPCQPPTLPDFPLQQEATKQPWKTLKQGVSVTSKTGKCCHPKKKNLLLFGFFQFRLDPPPPLFFGILWGTFFQNLILYELKFLKVFGLWLSPQI